MFCKNPPGNRIGILLLRFQATDDLGANTFNWLLIKPWTGKGHRQQTKSFVLMPGQGLQTAGKAAA